MTTLHLTVSGNALAATHVFLHPGDRVAEWRSMVGRAQAMMGGVSSPVGFLGSPEWVIGGAVVSGLLASAASNAMAKEGVKTLVEAQSLLADIRKAARQFEVRSVTGIELPYPAGWRARAPGGKMVEFNKVPMLQRSAFLQDHGRAKSDVANGWLMIDAVIDWTLLDTDCVSLQTSDGPVAVRWPAVDTYHGLRSPSA